MALPQNSPSGDLETFDGYILKNFSFQEEIVFGSFDDAPNRFELAPNRGGDYNQNCKVLFYFQRIFFDEGPQNGYLVHVENGSWLYLTTGPQSLGPFPGQGEENGPPQPQPREFDIAKQISVPHGNSILAIGGVDDVSAGLPTIQDARGVLPTGVKVERYTTKYAEDANFENPLPDWTLNPNAPLQIAVKQIQPTSYLHWKVSTKTFRNEADSLRQQNQPLSQKNHGIGVTNIPFEQRRAAVTDYDAEYWLLYKENQKPYLLYTQVISTLMFVKDRFVKFPHITSGVLQKKINIKRRRKINAKF